MIDPAQTLTDVQRLRARTRRFAHGGAWVPAAVLAALVLSSTVLYRYPFESPRSIVAAYPFWAGLPDQPRAAAASYAFWLVGLPTAFAVIAWWYRRRARRVGMRVPWPLFVTVGLGALALLVILAAVPSEPPANPDWLAPAARVDLIDGFATPLLAVAASLVALGWVERSPSLALAGAWFGLWAWWQCATGLVGALPGWLDWVLGGGQGPALGGQLGLRPAGMLVLMLLPLLVFVIVGAGRSRGGAR